MAQTLNNLADRLSIGDPLVSGSLTIYPLFFSGGKKVNKEDAPDQKETHYLLLEEALDKGTFEVGEASESGMVNTIIVTNQTGEPVLILDGEELLGAKQNRMVNATIMVATGKNNRFSCLDLFDKSRTLEKL